MYTLYFGVQGICSLLVVGLLAIVLFFFTVQNGHYVWNKKQLLSLNPNNVDYLLGEFLHQRHYEHQIEV